MNRTIDLLYILLMTAMFFCIAIIAYDGFEQSMWKDRCKDAGGIPASHSVCVNPGAVIEVE